MLTSERDKISQLYDETREELHNVRKELLKCAKSSNVSLAAQAVLKRVETERDTAIYDLRNVCNERDTYKDRLRVSFTSLPNSTWSGCLISLGNLLDHK